MAMKKVTSQVMSSNIGLYEHININQYCYSGVTAGTWVTVGATLAEQTMNEFMYNSSGAQNNQIDYKSYFTGGTYSFRVKFDRNTDRGIITLLVDGSSVGTVDTYGTSARNQLGTITGISIPAGAHTISLKVESKNASSSAYYVVYGMMGFWRTA